MEEGVRMGVIPTTSIRSTPAVDSSPSGPKNGCSVVPGFTPFAIRLRPVGAAGIGIVEDLPRLVRTFQLAEPSYTTMIVGPIAIGGSGRVFLRGTDRRLDASRASRPGLDPTFQVEAIVSSIEAG